MRKTLLAIISIFIALFLISSCNSELRVHFIAFEEESLDFFVGESLSLSPFKIYADTNNGRMSISPDAVEYDERTFTKDDVGKAITLRFDYMGFSFSATANVYEKIDSITVEQTGNAKKYYQYATERGAYNNTFDKSAYTVTAHYANGRSRVLTADNYTATLFDDTKIGESSLTIKTLIGGGVEIPYSVQVVQDPILSNSLTFLYPPVENSIYTEGDKDSWVITGSLIYESGYTILDFKSASITGVSGDFYFQDGSVNRYKEGAQNVGITYKEENGTIINFDVNFTSAPDYIVSFDAASKGGHIFGAGERFEVGNNIDVTNIVYYSEYTYPEGKEPEIRYSFYPEVAPTIPAGVEPTDDIDVEVTATLVQSVTKTITVTVRCHVGEGF